MKNFFLYVLQSEKNGKYYIGSTGDITNRLDQHNRGKSRFTKGHIPWKVVYKEAFSSRSKAVMRERFFKSGAGRKYLKQLLPGGEMVSHCPLEA